MKFLFLLTVVPLALFANQENSINLTPHYQKGQKQEYAGDLDITLIQKIPAPQKCDLHYHFVLQGLVKVFVSEVNHDKSADLNVEIIDPAVKFSLKCNMENGMSFDLSFDSMEEGPAQIKEMDMAKSLVDCLSDARFLVKVNDKGHIVNVKGIDDFQKKVQEKLKDSPKLQSSGQDLCALLEPGHIQKVASYFTLYLPDHPVKKGETWEKTYHLLGRSITQKWTFQGEKDNTYTLTENAQIPEGPLEVRGGTQVLDSIAGNLSETLKLNKETLWMTSQEGDLKASGTQSITLPGMEKPVKIQYQMTGKSALKVSHVE